MKWTAWRGVGVGDAWELTAPDGVIRAVAEPGGDLPADHAPRPFLHPVRTRAGRLVTAIAPDDHPHHYGVSHALSDVNGTSFWGGRTYVPHQGSTMLDNHGTQRITDASASAGTLRLSVDWLARDGALLLTEERTLRATDDPDGWTLTWVSELTARTRLTIGSSATKGRAGAGYGGVFWRFPVEAAPPRLSTVEASGEAGVHGSTSSWLHVRDAQDAWRVTLIRTGPIFPWFARAQGYAGAGPALAFHTPLTLASGARLRHGLSAEIRDGDAS